MTAPNLNDRLVVAVEAAREAGALLLAYQDRGLTVETKSTATDPVSEADRAAEVLVMERLAAAFPQDGLVGEEAKANREGSSGLRWVVDPLDGTVNYLYGLNAWGVSIACQDVASEDSLVGVVHHPLLHETFIAVREGGARLLGPDDPIRLDAGRPLKVATPDRPAMALVATGYNYDAEVRAVQAHRIAGLASQVRDMRRGGAAALDLAWTAAGRLDAYGEHGLAPWDWMAGILLVSEAGGKVVQRDDVLAGHEMHGIFAGDPETVDLLLSCFDDLDAVGGPVPA